ncbi:MAG: ATP-binding protein [Methylocystis sp.]|uniref:ATP-binding protein n=1 Tax=Methylocystis sp. TaxID=1911079 RepID=UPI003DA43B34
MLRRTIGPEIRLELILDAAQSVACDPSQLESALLNLAINARDAMPEGGVLRIRLIDRKLTSGLEDPELEPGSYVEIEVSDDGVGMSPEQLIRVLEPFFTTKPTGKGTGLGLPQVYGFARQSGGNVRICSSINKGTTVQIFLPACKPSMPAAATEMKVEGQKMPPRRNHRGKALVVEDQPEVRSLITDTIEDMGLIVIVASDGQAGMDVIESCEPLDLLITDVGLPGVSGRHIAEAARAAQPSIPILLITGYAGELLDAFQATESVSVLRKRHS